MARFRFDLENEQEIIKDEEGVEADDLDHAIEQAVLAIEEMRASGELTKSDSNWELVIRDVDGTELRRIRL